AFHESVEHLVPTPVKPTMAEGIATPKPTRVAEALRAVRKTGGTVSGGGAGVGARPAAGGAGGRRGRSSGPSGGSPASASTSSQPPRWPPPASPGSWTPASSALRNRQIGRA